MPYCKPLRSHGYLRSLDSGVVPMNILIADDKRHMRRVLRSLIEGHEGWEVCAEAADGVQAVNRAKQFQPDLIILDLAMPELNGIEAAGQISQALPGVPILIFTLYASPQIEREAEKVGVQRVISKSTGYMLVPAIEEAWAQSHHQKAV
jgi:DNA-binding NarL/FixJ family response regulator